MIAVEQIGRDDLVIVVRGMRERAATVDVAKRPDAGNAGAQLIVDLDEAALVGGDAGFVETEVVRYWDCGRRRAADASRRSRAAPSRSSRGSPRPRRAARASTHWALRRNAMPSASSIAWTAAETSGSSRAIDARRHLDHGDAAAEAPVHLREFEADVAAADDDQVLAAGNRRPSCWCWSDSGRRRGPACRAPSGARRC